MIPFIPPEFHFLRPWWFAALLPIVIMLPLLWKKKLQGHHMQNFCDPALLPHLILGQSTVSQNRSLPLILLALAWLATVIALTGPAWQRLEQPVFSVNKDRVLVLDLSPSMMASDVQPNRLARAIYKLKDILERCKEGRTGLVVFGGEAHVVVPLTDDITTIETMLPALQVDIIPEPGDRSEDALDAAAALLRRGGAKSGDIILLTDGVADVAAALSTLDKLRTNHLRLSVLAVGTETGAPAPGVNGAFAEGADGAVRISRVNISDLKELAVSGGGVFNMMTSDDDDLDHILAAGPATAIEEQESRLDREMERWRDEGIWLLPFILVLASFGLRKGWVLGLAFLLLSSTSLPAEAFEWADMWSRRDQRAARLLEQGDAAGAAALFDDPAWQGAARYQAGDYQNAAEIFKNQAHNPYNLGNSLAREGKLDQALKAFEEALKQNSGDEDALHNRDLIKKLLEEQKQQQQQQDKQGNSGGNQKESKDSDQQQNKEQNQQQKDQNKDSGQGKDQAKDKQSSPENQQGNEPSPGEQDNSRPPENQAAQQNKGREEQTDQQRDDQKSDPTENPQGRESAEQEADQDGEHDEGKSESRPAQPTQEQQAQPENEHELRSGVEDEAGEPMSEEEMAVEQWLRQVPDDPSKLLRRKFMMEHMRNKGNDR
ncbi:MAG: VWA domain-containing protein [Desulfobulbaceae bacterium]|nr:VWA domain-containing protein [Desulfobulbaceae bacterium]